MPPWPSRLLSPNTRHEEVQNSTPSKSDSPARPRPRVTEADIIDNAYGIPTLQGSPQVNRNASGTIKPIGTPNHTRSMSHPFPALFSGKKKRPGESAGAFGLESDDDFAAQKSAGKQKVQDKDLKTGKCMTCDSMVRWPKELSCFRCSVCFTINDLKPVTLEARPGDGHREPVAHRSGTTPGRGSQSHHSREYI